MTQNDTEVPVAPKYKGKLVLNTNVGKKMHLIAKYYTFFGRLEGIYSDAYDTLVNTIVQRRKDDMMSTVFVEGPPGCGNPSSAFPSGWPQRRLQTGPAPGAGRSPPRCNRPAARSAG